MQSSAQSSLMALMIVTEEKERVHIDHFESRSLHHSTHIKTCEVIKDRAVRSRGNSFLDIFSRKESVGDEKANAEETQNSH